MKITIIGTGYVGLVTGVCLSKVGNQVICFDINRQKINNLNKGKVPIYEPRLKSRLKSSIKSQNLKFSFSPKISIKSSDVIMICVGTPTKSNGDTDLSHIQNAIKIIIENLNSDKIVVIRSTVPVGTSIMLKKEIRTQLKKREYLR